MECVEILRGEEQMRVGTNKRGEKRRTGSVSVAGVRIRGLPACERPPVSEIAVFGCVCVCVRRRVCAYAAKWNGRSCREYNRGPPEVASRLNPSLPLTL